MIAATKAICESSDKALSRPTGRPYVKSLTEQAFGLDAAVFRLRAKRPLLRIFLLYKILP